jgi:hypothetical protein
MDTKKLLISGASVAAGAGLSDVDRKKFLWANQVGKESDYQVENISVIGSDNLEIFLNTSNKILDDFYDLILVQWQSIPCKNLDLGLETYNTKLNLIGTRPIWDINLYSHQKITSKTLQSCRHVLMRYYKEHWEIKELVSYCKILSYLANNMGTKIKFINYNLPWDQNRFFDYIEWTYPSELDEFTKSLIDVDFRDDFEIKEIYKLIHWHYAAAGPVNPVDWLNLYDPLKTYQIDSISTIDKHPGIQSQLIFKNKILAWLIISD